MQYPNQACQTVRRVIVLRVFVIIANLPDVLRVCAFHENHVLPRPFQVRRDFQKLVRVLMVRNDALSEFPQITRKISVVTVGLAVDDSGLEGLAQIDNLRQTPENVPLPELSEHVIFPAVFAANCKRRAVPAAVGRVHMTGVRLFRLRRVDARLRVCKNEVFRRDMTQLVIRGEQRRNH